jgi:hypothetical protein
VTAVIGCREINDPAFNGELDVSANLAPLRLRPVDTSTLMNLEIFADQGERASI